MKKILLLVLIISCFTLLFVSCQTNTENPDNQTTQTSDAEGTTEADDPIPDSPDFIYEVINGTAVITDYVGEGGDIVLPKTLGGYAVSEIVSFTFAQNDTIISVTYPGELKTTGEFAFYSCANLEKVVLGEGIQTISRGCFSDCPKLSSVNIPSSLTKIDDVAFQADKSLKNVTLNDGLLSIGTRAFANSGITSIVFPSSITVLKESIFDFAEELVSAIFNNQMEELPEGIFSNCFALKEVSLPTNLTTVGYEAFMRCTSLEKLVLPGTLTHMGERSLYGCTSLKQLYFCSTTMKRFHKYVFHWLPALTDIYFAGTEEAWNAIKISDYNEELEDNHIIIHYNFNDTTAIYG